MKQEEANIPEKDSDHVNNSRREFLRKSVFAAYATPLITALLVEEASAKNSGNPVDCNQTPNHPDCRP